MDYYVATDDLGAPLAVWRRNPETTEEQWYNPAAKEWQDSGSLVAGYLVNGRIDLDKESELAAHTAIAGLVAAA